MPSSQQENCRQHEEQTGCPTSMSGSLCEPGCSPNSKDTWIFSEGRLACSWQVPRDLLVMLGLKAASLGRGLDLLCALQSPRLSA